MQFLGNYVCKRSTLKNAKKSQSLKILQKFVAGKCAKSIWEMSQGTRTRTHVHTYFVPWNIVKGVFIFLYPVEFVCRYGEVQRKSFINDRSMSSCINGQLFFSHFNLLYLFEYRSYVFCLKIPSTQFFFYISQIFFMEFYLIAYTRF